MLLTEFCGSVSFSSSGHVPSRRGSLVLRTLRLQRGSRWLRQEEWNFCGIKSIILFITDTILRQPKEVTWIVLSPLLSICYDSPTLGVLVLLSSRLNHHVRKMLTTVALTAGWQTPGWMWLERCTTSDSSSGIIPIYKAFLMAAILLLSSTVRSLFSSLTYTIKRKVVV